LCGGFASNFIFLADLPDFEKAIDDVWFGSVTDSGPAQVPESSVFVFLGTGAAVLFLGRRRRFAVSFSPRCVKSVLELARLDAHRSVGGGTSKTAPPKQEAAPHGPRGFGTVRMDEELARRSSIASTCLDADNVLA